MRMSSRVLLALATAWACPQPAGAAEKAVIERIVSVGRESSQVMDHLDHLSNRVGPRLTGSDALQNGCEWARDRFRGFGIDNARLERWGEFPVGFNRGPWSGRMVDPESKPLTFGTDSWTAGTKGLVRGRAVMMPEDLEGLAAAPETYRGAWVLIGAARGGAPDAAARKARDAALAGAKVAGVVRTTRNELIVTGGNYQVDWEKLPEVPTVNLIQPQFDEVAALVRDGKPVTLEFDIRNYFEEGPIPLYNVVADIPGTEFPEEYVIVGGHIDTWDGATGTTDNGTGCATTLEAARILVQSGLKPRRTIRFMLWSGEEQGLMGSKAYCKAHADLMPRISAVLVHDGGTNYLSGIRGTKAQKADLDAVFAPATGLDSALPFEVREVAGLRGGGSDHDSFLAAGVPAFFWRQSGKAVYNRTHHTQNDTYDAAIPEYQKHSAIVAALGAYGIADLDHLLSREAMISAGGAPSRRVAGVQLDGLKVNGVMEGSPAAQAGVREGDAIAKVDGKAVADLAGFQAAIQDGGPSKALVILRDGKEVEVTLAFPARP